MDKNKSGRGILIAASTTKSNPVAQPPPPLATAIDNAANQYKVPPDLLAGIWRVESGGSYPNPYGNGKGYGGLFGTSNWASGPITQINSNLYTTSDPTSVQAQANEAASVLNHELNINKGDIGKALFGYSGGGYTSVPGQVTQGTIANYSSGGYFPSASSQQSLAQQAGSAISSGASSAVNAATGGITSDLSTVGNDVLYGLAFIGGGLLILGGLILIGADIGIAAFRGAKNSNAGQLAGSTRDKFSPSQRRARADTEARSQRAIQVKSETQEARLYQAQQNAENARQRRLVSQQKVKRERARNKPIKGDIPF